MLRQTQEKIPNPDAYQRHIVSYSISKRDEYDKTNDYIELKLGELEEFQEFDRNLLKENKFNARTERFKKSNAANFNFQVVKDQFKHQTLSVVSGEVDRFIEEEFGKTSCTEKKLDKKSVEARVQYNDHLQKELQHKKEELVRCLDESEDFVTSLRERPKNVLNDAMSAIENFVSEYEVAHLGREQSPTERLVLLQLAKKINEIKKDHVALDQQAKRAGTRDAKDEKHQQERTRATEARQEMFLELSSMLWAIEKYFLEREQRKGLTLQEATLRKELFDMIKNNIHIDIDDGLPDEMSKETCEKRISSRKTAGTPLFNPALDLAKGEDDAYKAQVKLLQTHLAKNQARITAILTGIGAVIDSERLDSAVTDDKHLPGGPRSTDTDAQRTPEMIRREKMIRARLVQDPAYQEYQLRCRAQQNVGGLLAYAKQNCNVDTMSFYMSVLREANAVMERRNITRNTFSRLSRLMDMAPGVPSTKRKIGGFLLGLVGLAMVGFVIATTAGFATVPIIVLGIAFSDSLLKLAGVAGGGAVLTALGGLFFAKGQRNKVSKSIHGVHEVGQECVAKDISLSRERRSRYNPRLSCAPANTASVAASRGDDASLTPPTPTVTRRR